MTTLDACAGDEDGDLMTIGEDVRDDLCDGGRVCKVGCVDGHFAAKGLYSFLCGCCFEVTL